jgi:hypothetical protein
MRAKALPAAVLLVAVTALVTSAGWAIAQGSGDGGSMMRQRVSATTGHHAPTGATELDRGMENSRGMMPGRDGGAMGGMMDGGMRGSRGMMRSAGVMCGSVGGMMSGAAGGMMDG